MQTNECESLLTAEEEVALAGRIALGDMEARRILIERNLKLVTSVARDYMGCGLPLQDLIGEGHFGLIRAAEKYDPKFGTRFATYATKWIMQSIRLGIMNTNNTIRLPVHMVRIMYKWQRMDAKLRTKLGRRPTGSEVVAALGLTQSQIRMARKAFRATRFSPDSEWDAATTSCQDQEIDDRDRIEKVLAAIEEMSDRDQRVIKLRYGLDGGEPMTLKEIGDRLGCTREWTRRLEERIVNHLKETCTCC